MYPVYSSGHMKAGTESCHPEGRSKTKQNWSFFFSYKNNGEKNHQCVWDTFSDAQSVLSWTRSLAADLPVPARGLGHHVSPQKVRLLLGRTMMLKQPSYWQPGCENRSRCSLPCNMGYREVRSGVVGMRPVQWRARKWTERLIAKSRTASWRSLCLRRLGDKVSSCSNYSGTSQQHFQGLSSSRVLSWRQEGLFPVFLPFTVKRELIGECLQNCKMRECSLHSQNMGSSRCSQSDCSALLKGFSLRV